MLSASLALNGAQSRGNGITGQSGLLGASVPPGYGLYGRPVLTSCGAFAEYFAMPPQSTEYGSHGLASGGNGQETSANASSGNCCQRCLRRSDRMPAEIAPLLWRSARTSGCPSPSPAPAWEAEGGLPVRMSSAR